MAMGASEEHRDTSAGRSQAVGLLSCAVLCGLLAACGRTGATRWRGDDPHRFALAGLSLHDHAADGRERDGTAGMEQTEVTDFHKAIGQDMLKESAEKLHDVEVGSAEAWTAHF